LVITHDVTSAVSIADTIWLMGRDRGENGEIIPGARLMEEIDLIERDICWHSDTVNRPAAIALIREIKEKFLDL
jgi:NitT/TauT family transport system ATP-binding protein